MKSVSETIFEEDGEWWFHHADRRTRAKIRTCETCREQFADFPSGKTEYCSAECRRRPCIRCGKAFQPVSNRNGYCSLACKRGLATCEGCGKRFIPNKHVAARFCTRPCFYDSTTPFGSVRSFGSNGYLIVKVTGDTPGAKVSYGPNKKKGWMLQHRYVMQQKLGRPLRGTEEVHHINGKRDDNRPENLELWKSSHPAGVRSADYHCAGCRCFDADFQCT